MVVDICFVCLKGVIIQRSIQILNCLLELFVFVVSQSSFVEDFWVSSLASQGVAKIINSFWILLDIDIDIASFHKEVLVDALSLQSLIKIVQSLLIIFHQAICLSDSLENTCVFRSKFFSVQEVFDCVLIASLPKLTKFNFRQTSQIVGFSISWFDFSSFIEVFNSFLIIFDILIHQTSALIDKTILSNSVQDFSQALQSGSELSTLVLHKTEVIQAGNMIVRNFKSSFEHVNCLIIFLCILISETLAVVKLRIAGHQFNSMIEIFMSEIYLLKRKVSVSSIEQSSCIIGVQIKSFVVLSQTFVVHLVVIEGQSFIIEISSFCSVELNRLLESFKGQVVLLIFEIAETEVVLRRSIILHSFTCFRKISYGFRVLLNLSIAITPMKQGLEIGLSSLDILESLSEVLNSVGKVHESGVDQSSIEIVKSIVGFEADCFLELSESVVDLVEHHHTVTSISIVLWVLVIESYGSSEVVHSFLVVSSCHEGIATICMVLGVG